MADSWADLFEHAERYDITLDDVQQTLAEHRDG